MTTTTTGAGEKHMTRINLGSPRIGRVRQVIICPLGVAPGDGWYMWASSGGDIPTINTADGQMAGVIWRAGATATVPAEARVVGREPLPVTDAEIDQWIEGHPRLAADHDCHGDPRLPDWVRLDRHDAPTWPYIWTAPVAMRYSDTEVAIHITPPSDTICWSVRLERDRWIAQTGIGTRLNHHGGFAGREEAEIIAQAILHTRWLEWANRMTERCGGRTDWCGGLAAPQRSAGWSQGE